MGWVKTGKGKLIAGVTSTTVVAGVAVVAGVLLLGGGAYRTIAVEETNGISIVENEKDGSNTAYEGMHLYSGDDVKVQEDSDMTMLLDMDKYVYAEPNTHFWLEAEGDSEKSKTKICLEEGSVLNCLRTELTEGETYEVDTPNSVMAVRGTVYRVNVFYDSDGIAYTALEVFQGAVNVELKTLEGEYNGVSEMFTAGEAALIRASNDFSEFVVGENGSVKQEIAYKEIPQKTAMQLVSYIDMGEELCIGKELLKDYTKLQEHKTEEIIVEEPTCTKEGKKEIYCTVCEEVDETVTIPALGHKLQEDWVVVTEAGCTTKGLEQKQCTVCGEVIETQEISALGHLRQAPVVTKEVGCLVDGLQVTYCARCGRALEETTLAALGHNYGAWMVTNPATCLVAGEEQHVCSLCQNVETQSIAALGHNYGAWTVTTPSTCTSTGSMQRVCSLCQNTETQTLPALGGHDYGAWTVISSATCTSAGSMQRVCSRCQDTDTQTIAALGHNHVWQHYGDESRYDSIFAENNDGLIEDSLWAEYICNRDGCGDVLDTGWHSITVERVGDEDSGYTYSYHCDTCETDIEILPDPGL